MLVHSQADVHHVSDMLHHFQLLLHFPTLVDLHQLFQICSPHNPVNISILHQAVRWYDTLQPHCHRLQSDQLPIIQTLNPAVELRGGVHLRRFQPRRGLNFHIEVLGKFSNQVPGLFVILLFVIILVEVEGVSFEEIIHSPLQMLGNVALNVCVHCRPAHPQHGHLVWV